MRDSLWIPVEDERRYRRPHVEAPSPFEYLPEWQPEEEAEADESPRVVIIDI